jgi:hypothetical protein
VISGDSYNGDETPKQCDSSPSNTNKDTTSSILIFEMNHFLPGSTLQPDNDAVLRVMSFQSSSQVLPAFPALVFLAAWPGRSVWIYKSSQHRRTDTPAYFQTKSVKVWKYAARVQGKLPFPPAVLQDTQHIFRHLVLSAPPWQITGVSVLRCWPDSESHINTGEQTR